MKSDKMMILVLSILTAVVFAGAATAGPLGNKMAAGRMIRRTGGVIRIAHKQVSEHKVYTGDLARAIAHQKFAKRLFHQGEYLRAMHQTRWARHLAVKAIIANNGQEPREAALTREEQALTANGPSEEQLTKEMTAAMPSEPTRDEAVINGKPDLDAE